jgi:hypothetical protein
MTPEARNKPNSADREHPKESAWIIEDLDVFWLFASRAFEETGRGAIVVDTNVQPTPGAGHPVGYFSQERIEDNALTTTKDERIRRMVAEYHPTEEYVLVLLRPGDNASAFRVGIIPPEPWDVAVDEAAPSQPAESAAEPKIVPPELETLMEWELARESSSFWRSRYRADLLGLRIDETAGNRRVPGRTSDG